MKRIYTVPTSESISLAPASMLAVSPSLGPTEEHETEYQFSAAKHFNSIDTDNWLGVKNNSH